MPASCCKRLLKETQLLSLLCSRGSRAKPPGSPLSTVCCHLIPALVILLWPEPGLLRVFFPLLQQSSLLSGQHCLLPVLGRRTEMWQLQAWLGKSTEAEDAVGLQPSEGGVLGWLQQRRAKSSIGKRA